VRWYAMSARFLTDPKVEKLGEQHGPAGPLVIVSLFAHAALQEKGGTVERTFRATANEAFVDRNEVQAIIATAVEIGLCHEVSRDVAGCVLTFPAWKRHQATGRKAKERASKKEGAKPHETADVTDSHDESHDVPHSTVQDKTRQSSTARVREGEDSEFAPIIQELDHIAYDRGLTLNVPAAVRACREHPDRDLPREARECRHKYVDGDAKTRKVTDVAGLWRKWLENATPAGNQGSRRTGKTKDRSKYARIEAAA
jgi:hypothetical protein